jgi:hypothetical protein
MLELQDTLAIIARIKWEIAKSTTSPSMGSPTAVATSTVLTNPGTAASPQSTILTAIATISAAIIAGIVGCLTTWYRAKKDLELESKRHEHEIQKLAEEHKYELEKVMLQANSDLCKEEERKKFEEERNHKVIQRAIEDRLIVIGDKLKKMEESIELLCCFSSSGQRITRKNEPVRLLKIIYDLHVPLACFRILCEMYNDKKDDALREKPILKHLWSIAECIDNTFIADNDLATTLYSPIAASAKTGGIRAHSVYQDLNPEAFLQELITYPPDVKRFSALRQQLPSGVLESSLLNARRVIEPFSIEETPVFWRILLAQLLLIQIFAAMQKQTNPDLNALSVDWSRFDPRQGNPKQPNDAEALNAHLDAARSYLKKQIGTALLPVVY